jgi:hypothetical protein
VMHICNLNKWKTEAGGLKVQGQSGLRNEDLSKKKKVLLEVGTMPHLSF